MRHFSVLFSVLVLASGFTVQAFTADGGLMASVTGQVFYRERMALPPGSVVIVKLVDVSRADVKATLLAEQRIENPATVPVLFQLDYDPAVIDARMSYAVQAQIRDAGGKLLWTTMEHIGVLTRDNPATDLQILVRRVSGSAPPYGK